MAPKLLTIALAGPILFCATLVALECIILYYRDSSILVVGVYRKWCSHHHHRFVLSFLPAKKAQSPNDKNILVENGLSSMKESVEFFVKSPAKTLESLRLKHK